MRKKSGFVLCFAGVLFLFFAVFGRYLVLPGYFTSLDSGSAGSGIPDKVPILLILRYLLWAYSYKLGIYLFALGALFLAGQTSRDRLIFAGGGFVYICFAYMPLEFNFSLFFGIGGGILTAFFLFLFLSMGREGREGTHGYNLLLQYFGLFFLAMAAYNLCPLCGVKCFALEPEKMIRYGLRGQALSFANHIMIELVCGFACMAASRLRLFWKAPRAS